MQQALDLRTALLAEGCGFTAQVQANLPEGLAEFTLSCACSPEGETLMEVAAPETIAGIQATVSPGAQDAAFPEVALSFGLLADGQVAPLVLPQLLYACWSGGFLREAGRDGELYSALYLYDYGDRELAVEQWFTLEGVPVSADFWFGMEHIATVNLTDFSLGTPA